MPYGEMDLGQHLLRQWLVAWRHQGITWTNVDLPSNVLYGIHLSAHEIDTNMCSAITLLKSRLYFQGANQWVKGNTIQDRYYPNKE